MTTQGLSWCLLFQVMFVVGVVSTECLDDQRLLLLQLKHNLVFDSEYSTKLVNWNQSADCCSWDGIACDSSGHVISLDLTFEEITGGIENSTGLFGLQYLQELNLGFNNFNGVQIPKGLENLTNLSYLNLSSSGFGGQIPTEVSTLRSLLTLDLSSGDQSITFTGYEPLILTRFNTLKLENPTLQMLVQNLTRLKQLYLDDVDISAEKGDWFLALSSSLPDLRTLSLQFCGLSGPLVSSISRLHSLSVLRLDGNNLSTKVDEFFPTISRLTTLTLTNCFLQGIVPETIFQVPTLEILDLSDNKLLSGTIPNSIGNLTMLSKIALKNCNFTGMIPSSISNLAQLVHMDFSSNSFTGPIPPFSMFDKLAYLDLSNNSLTCSLSSKHFEGLSSLLSINLGFNKLNGRVPPSLFGLPSLYRLQLSNNKFSGQINEFSISNPSILDTVDLSNNQLEGSLPESFFKLERLRVASLSSNLLNGTIKLERFERFSNLTELWLGYNKFSVDTSNSTSILPQLSRLDLASCNMYKFPDLRNKSHLVTLDLSNNHIAGEIPSWMWTIGGGLFYVDLSSNFITGLQKPVNMSPFLVAVDLHSNKIQGELPLPPKEAIFVDYSSNKFQQPIPINILNNHPYLRFFSLANNSLKGTIPTSLCNAVGLELLDLSHNHLSGSIPPCLLGNVNTSLGVLNMRGNDISGNVTDAFSVNCSLQTLDLSNNRIGGTIPPSMANCKSLQVVNVGNNKIHGTFPCWLMSVSSLHVLILRNNNFHGDLECFGVNESWSNLQIIDIASNNFGGVLDSRYFASWRGMILDNNSTSRDGHLSFRFQDPNLSFLQYQDAVTVTVKGLELEIVKILTIFTTIDFSDNKFLGEIPQTVGDLTSLYVLNLSSNAFTNIIPNSIGSLKQLESLDLSVNQLVGKIPEELTEINFLSVLNLSYNKLSGRIPNGPQFQTFSASSFAGNPELCGFPSEAICDLDEHEVDSTASSNKKEYDWQLIMTGAGYGVGLVLVVVPVAVCKQWREYYTKRLDQFLMLLFPRFILANSRGRRIMRAR